MRGCYECPSPPPRDSDGSVSPYFGLTVSRLLIPCLLLLQIFSNSDYPNSDADVVKACLHSGLTFHEMTLVVTCRKNTKFQCNMEEIGPAIFSLVDKDGSGTITFEEVSAAVRDPQLVDIVNMTQCTVLMRLFNSRSEKASLAAFKRADKDGNNAVDLTEFMTFLNYVRYDRLEFFKKQFLIAGRLYAGLGMQPGEPSSVRAFRELGLVRGYWEDFTFYCQQNHPVLVMFFADSSHPYSEAERGAEFFAAMMTTFFGAGLAIFFENQGDGGDIGPFIVLIIFVTIPTSLFRQLAYWLFASPCFVYDKSKNKGTAWAACLDACDRTLDIVG